MLLEDDFMDKLVLTETNKSIGRRTPPDSSDNPPRIDSEVSHLDLLSSKKIKCVQDETVIVNPWVVLQRQK